MRHDNKIHLREFRFAYGEAKQGKRYTVTQVAKGIGFDHSMVSKVESGDKKPSLEFLLACADFFGVPVAALFYPPFEFPEEKQDARIGRINALPPAEKEQILSTIDTFLEKRPKQVKGRK